MVFLKSALTVMIFISAISCSAEKNTKNKTLPEENQAMKKGNSQLAEDDGEIRNVKGTIVYHELEGGFYGIIADNGKKYNPINLDEEFQQDGLRVKFDANIKKGMVGIHMWGVYVEILKIEKIEEK